jgi:hypothetical protein
VIEVGAGIVGVHEVILLGVVGLLGIAAVCAKAEADRLKQSVDTSRPVIFLFMKSLLKMYVKTFFRTLNCIANSDQIQ